MGHIFGKLICTLCLVGGLAGASNAVWADTFQGTLWTLSYGSALPDADPAHESFLVKLGVDTNGYTGSGSFLDQVALKVGSALFSIALEDAPSGVAAWSLGSGGVNAGGCSGSGSGFACVNSLAGLNGGKGVALSPGNGPGTDYSWLFRVTVANGTLFTSPGEASIKARFVDTNGRKTGDLVSEPITLLTTTASSVPEPAACLSMLVGLGVLGLTIRRKQNLCV